jgi:VWFA-related protein
MRCAVAVVTIGMVCLLGFVEARRQTAISPAQGQTPGQPVFRAGTDVIQVDVSVLDRNRRPVHGLTRADFTILEDGKPQSIVAFAAVDAPEAAPPPPVAWVRDVVPDVQTNDFPDGRLFVLLLDDAMIPGEPQMIKSAKAIGQRVIDRLGPTDRMAVVFSVGSRGNQDFTGEHTKLSAAVDTLNGGYSKYTLGWDTADPASLAGRTGVSRPEPVHDYDETFRYGSFLTLRNVADALIAAPARRKVLVFVSPGLPVNFEETGPLLAGGTGSLSIQQANARIVDEMPELFHQMQRANITVYAIDPCGLDGLEALASGILRAQPALRDARSDSPKSPDALAHTLATNDRNFLVATATNTGGRAIVNTNDFEPGIADIFSENGSYYLLGYRATDPGASKYHRVSVRVNRPDVEARTRSGYWTAAADKAPGAVPALDKATAGPLPTRDLALRVALAPMALAGPTTDAAVAIVFGLRQAAASVPAVETIQVRIDAFTPDGEKRGSQSQTVRLTLKPGGDRDVVAYEILSHINLKPGRYSLRLAAERASDHLTGSVYADLDVPDFGDDPVSLSGVLLGSSPAVPSVPKDALASIVPFAPTAEREFARVERAVALVRVYEGGKAPLAPVSFAVRLVNDHDARVVDTTEMLGADRFHATTRATDYRFMLPLSTLASGQYLLTFEVTLGKTVVRRDVRFSVR